MATPLVSNANLVGGRVGLVCAAFEFVGTRMHADGQTPLIFGPDKAAVGIFKLQLFVHKNTENQSAGKFNSSV